MTVSSPANCLPAAIKHVRRTRTNRCSRRPALSWLSASGSALAPCMIWQGCPTLSACEPQSLVHAGLMWTMRYGGELMVKSCASGLEELLMTVCKKFALEPMARGHRATSAIQPGSAGA
eukprot:scaffold122816_cov35-Tisochrysis_lutea.AAC.1